MHFDYNQVNIMYIQHYYIFYNYIVDNTNNNSYNCIMSDHRNNHHMKMFMFIDELLYYRQHYVIN